MQLDPSRRPTADLALDLQHGTPVEASRSCAEILRRFEPLFRKYWQRLRSGARSSDIEYDDFLQEIAKKMAASITGLRNPHAFPGYLQRIVMTTMVEMVRRASRATSPQDLIDLIGHARNEGLDILVVGSYLAQLPLREALALELSVIRELDAAECAHRMGLSPSGFRTLKSRAIKELRNIINDQRKLISET
ncbi:MULTISPECIES: sigma-70 family RNA polymerase sigma factor [unclassified Bradyrhizobium]|uniref:RNA polymerase sigma factor n=1 Tax=unclassified Bradyrhizobium TaxID=2631580 RepID=UPI001FF7E98B|nr:MULTISPECIES: sigma-70 family RNA polymerase sigma factor [unclassified Bradyrhizobium]MCK1535819.1 sigma-70 family RNA polymerase sigma factor [Bradyrhizobium sp. 176]MCK1555382.1 sigma-70 family RNA polymerase sigma factor [Bradyrhizobium sp. 171]MCK1688681.1 sigma-70 family RNA polymerase sigma factor [Bradyrhizobium sp. 145]